MAWCGASGSGEEATNWSIGDHMTWDLVLAALNIAIEQGKQRRRNSGPPSSKKFV